MLKRKTLTKTALTLVMSLFMTLLITMNASASTTIEDIYSASGGTAVSSTTISAQGQSYTNYKVWYPTNLNAGPYPVIVWANGTGETYLSPGYEGVFSSLASWGFVVVCNNDGGDGDGSNALVSANDIISYNYNPLSIFFNKLDVNKVGIGGHSQGGPAAINASTKYLGSNIFKSIYTASAASQSLCTGFLAAWEYKPSLISVPYFATAGTGNIDSNIITPLDSMQQNYNQLSVGVPSVMGRVKNTDHGDIVPNSHGYLNAWFLYTLKGDIVAGLAFKGTNPEISTNNRWQDIATKNIP